VLPHPSVTYAAYYNRNAQRYNDYNTGFYNVGSLIGGGGGHRSGGGGGHGFGGGGGHGYGGGGGHGYGVGGGHGYYTTSVSYGHGGGGHGGFSKGGSSGYGDNAGYREIYEHGVDNGHGGSGNRGFGGRIRVLRMRRTRLADGKGASVVRVQVARKPTPY